MAYQFVAGLKPNLKSKLAGVEGTLDQLLVKTRFEEAKAHECYHCHGTGRIQKNSPMRGRAAPQESCGRSSGAATSAEVDESLCKVVATMRILKSTNGDEGNSLGLTLSACVEFKGRLIEALLDTRSAVPIVPMRFLLQALAKQKLKEQGPTKWAAAVKSRLEPPSLTFYNYGGDEQKVVRQLMAIISREGHTCTATVLVQKDAPLDLLVGTDLQTQLGFLFLQKKTTGTAVDLL